MIPELEIREFARKSGVPETTVEEITLKTGFYLLYRLIWR